MNVVFAGFDVDRVPYDAPTDNRIERKPSKHSKSMIPALQAPEKPKLFSSITIALHYSDLKMGATAMATNSSAAAAPVAQNFTGVFRFPGEFAFLEKFNIADFALLQSDDPFTGKFNQAAAENTCAALAARHQDGDPANLSGQLWTCDVEGRQTPVLFMFK